MPYAIQPLSLIPSNARWSASSLYLPEGVTHLSSSLEQCLWTFLNLRKERSSSEWLFHLYARRVHSFFFLLFFWSLCIYPFIKIGDCKIFLSPSKGKNHYLSVTGQLLPCQLIINFILPVTEYWARHSPGSLHIQSICRVALPGGGRVTPCIWGSRTRKLKMSLWAVDVSVQGIGSRNSLCCPSVLWSHRWEFYLFVPQDVLSPTSLADRTSLG